MMVTMAGAMSTAELGLSLAEMIRADKVHSISCTGANLEEDLYNLIAHDYYERVPNYRDLSPAEERDLLERQLNRVTDTCIPEEEAMRRLERAVFEHWEKADTVRGTALPARVPLPGAEVRRAGTVLSYRPEEFVDGGSGGKAAAHGGAGVGRLHPGQHVCRAVHARRDQESHDRCGAVSST